jgi:hypothetical protein
MQSLRRRPFEVSERVKYVAHVEIWPSRDDCVSAPPERLDALGPRCSAVSSGCSIKLLTR